MNDTKEIISYPRCFYASCLPWLFVCVAVVLRVCVCLSEDCVCSSEDVYGFDKGNGYLCDNSACGKAVNAFGTTAIDFLPDMSPEGFV